MPRHRGLFTLIFCLAGLLAYQDAFAFRCGNKLVSKGDAKITVLDKCGKPDSIDRWSEELIDQPDTDAEHRVLRINERWVYNPGPAQFIRIVTFVDGRVTTIETGGRGFTVVPGMKRCSFNTLSLGTTTAEITALCGEPDMKEQRYETVSHPTPGGRREVSVSIDEWTFNLGPNHFMRILTFRNGSLESIKTGERGFK
jgi:hypothetical protein